MLISNTLSTLLLALATAQQVIAQARVTLTAKVVVTAVAAAPGVVKAAPALPLAPGDVSACPVFDRCLSDVQTTLDATCSPLRAGGNKTSFAQCQCIFAKSLNLCYATCPDDAAVQAAGAAQSSTVSKLCASASLNPDHLPTVAPWQTVFSPTPTPTTPTTMGAVFNASAAISSVRPTTTTTMTTPLAIPGGAITSADAGSMPTLGPDAASNDAAERRMRGRTTRFMPLLAVFVGVLGSLA
ncbi:hypothetical protein BDZ88DRAFT_413298 [Geranomyces variabilis]|nr:hypothetical protein BDZ88DRAFT_413298 [Geranomyces variabilis]